MNLSESGTDTRSLEEVGQWVYDTCRLFGAPVDTALTVAGLFCNGLREKGWS